MASNVQKVSVAIGLEELAWARERAEREGTSLSAVLSAAARVAREVEEESARRNAAWSGFLRWATEDAPLTDEELAAADQELNGT